MFSFGSLYLLLFGRRTAGPPGAPGGSFRRADWSWDSTFTRDSVTWPRTWSFTVIRIPPETLTKTVSDDRDYLFDYSRVAELVGGGEIASAVIAGGSGLTIGSPAVSETKKVVTARIAGGTANTAYDLACRATLTTGRVLVIPARLVVAADY